MQETLPIADTAFVESITTPSLAPVEGEVDLFAFFLMLRGHLWRIVLWTTIGFLCMLAYALLVPPRFQASTSFFVPQTSSGSAAAAAALQASSGLDLFGSGGGISAVYLDMLRSRTISDRMISRFNLKSHYGAKTLAMAEQALAGSTTLSGEREGLVTITVQDGDPKLAAEMANTYVGELDHLNQHLAISSAAVQRRYYEQEMIKEKNQLAEAEVALRETQELTGVIEPQMQAQSGLNASDTTRAQLRARQVQLGALLQSETPQNPDVVRLQAEITSLEGQLRAMQSGGSAATSTPAIKVPGVILANVRDTREVRFHEALFELLAREYESAKEQEAKDFSLIQVLDPATTPEKKAWPPRTLYCILGLTGGAIAGIVYTILEALLTVIFRNPENRARYHALRSGSARS